jgi:hypothetical protein
VWIFASDRLVKTLERLCTHADTLAVPEHGVGDALKALEGEEVGSAP